MWEDLYNCVNVQIFTQIQLQYPLGEEVGIGVGNKLLLEQIGLKWHILKTCQCDSMLVILKYLEIF